MLADFSITKLLTLIVFFPISSILNTLLPYIAQRCSVYIAKASALSA